VDADPIVLVPGTPEWLREMTASKVAAVVGLSPWQSRFSLWFEMAGQVPHPGPSVQMERGHYLEDAIARWLSDQYGFSTLAGMCWRNRARPWQVASPDRLALPVGGRVARDAHAVVEVKTAADYGEWGPDGTDEIPPHYRVQAVWQCDTLGLPQAYVGVLLPRLEFRGYVIRPADGEAEWLRQEARAFLDSLAAQEPPDVDEHSATYAALRVLHPSIVPKGQEGSDVPVGADLAVPYARSVLALKAAETEYGLQRNKLAVHMGTARRAVYDDRTVAIRQPGPTGTPYPKAGTARVLAAIAQEEPDEQ
jgi:putative phage-type endonuclease